MYAGPVSATTNALFRPPITAMFIPRRASRHRCRRCCQHHHHMAVARPRWCARSGWTTGHDQPFRWPANDNDTHTMCAHTRQRQRAISLRGAAGGRLLTMHRSHRHLRHPAASRGEQPPLPLGNPFVVQGVLVSWARHVWQLSGGGGGVVAHRHGRPAPKRSHPRRNRRGRAQLAICTHEVRHGHDPVSHGRGGRPENRRQAGRSPRSCPLRRAYSARVGARVCAPRPACCPLGAPNPATEAPPAPAPPPPRAPPLLLPAATAAARALAALGDDVTPGCLLGVVRACRGVLVATISRRAGLFHRERQQGERGGGGALVA